MSFTRKLLRYRAYKKRKQDEIAKTQSATSIVSSQTVELISKLEKLINESEQTVNKTEMLRLCEEIKTNLKLQNVLVAFQDHLEAKAKENAKKIAEAMRDEDC